MASMLRAHIVTFNVEESYQRQMHPTTAKKRRERKTRDANSEYKICEKGLILCLCIHKTHLPSGSGPRQRWEAIAFAERVIIEKILNFV